MALSAPSTPRTNLITPKKLIGNPNNAEHITRTPKTNFATPKQRILQQSQPHTPECFTNVQLETPSHSALKRRRSSKEKFDEESNLTVAVRIRPMNTRELSIVGSCDIVRVKNQEIIIRSQLIGNSSMGLDHVFQYDHVFWSCDESSPVYTNQEDVFMTIGKPLLNSAFRGYNACLFAYGQTGSGKSFSMMGKNTCEAVDIDSEEYSGLTPRFCRDLFERIAKLPAGSSATVEVSYFEIYNEKIHDLLAANPNASNRMPLKVREHPEWGPYVVDLSVHPVTTYAELRNWLLLGNKNRATAATSMNEKSSRSHSIFSIELCLTNCEEAESSRRSKVNLVDLAGSERIGNSHNSEEKIRQGVCINKSLLTLGKVISSLADQKRNQFIPYRDSVLTWLLRESLGGNSLTSMLATISPANTHLDETLATLRYACQARSIVNRARINENPHDKLIRELKSEVQRLKALKQDYERNSMMSLSACSSNDDCKDELDELRSKLNSAESKLMGAEHLWQQRFMESTQNQLKELAASEKRREELESRMRIMKHADQNVDLSLYKTNFLEELECVLLENNEDLVENDEIVAAIVDWCCQNQLCCTTSSDMIKIVDNANEKQAFVGLKDVHQQVQQFDNLCDFFNSLTWTTLNRAVKKLTKSEIVTSINQIYQALNHLKPAEDENQLNLLFAKVNKSVQSFEAALLNNIAKTNATKSVTFNL